MAKPNYSFEKRQKELAKKKKKEEKRAQKSRVSGGQPPETQPATADDKDTPVGDA